MATAIEMWEAQSGAGVSFIFNTERPSAEQVSLEVMDENDEEVTLRFPIHEFKSLMKAGLRFDEKLSGVEPPS